MGLVLMRRAAEAEGAGRAGAAPNKQLDKQRLEQYVAESSQLDVLQSARSQLHRAVERSAMFGMKRCWTYAVKKLLVAILRPLRPQ